MKQIKISRDLIALVDDEDYEHLSQWVWTAHSRNGYFYAARNQPLNGNRFILSMHRYLMGVNNPNIIVDHKDRDTLNNQKSNLRVCTKSQNCANRIVSKKSLSQYLGVSFNKKRRLWSAQLTKNQKQIRLGFYSSEEEAAMAYNNCAVKYHGDFANLNVISKR